jgi:hypothetical protein
MHQDAAVIAPMRSLLPIRYVLFDAISYQPGFQAFKAEKFILHLSLQDLTRARL